MYSIMPTEFFFFFSSLYFWKITVWVFFFSFLKNDCSVCVMQFFFYLDEAFKLHFFLFKIVVFEMLVKLSYIFIQDS
jgi:hypothetical protein